jgi:hypothetical protein
VQILNFFNRQRYLVIAAGGFWTSFIRQKQVQVIIKWRQSIMILSKN